MRVRPPMPHSTERALLAVACAVSLFSPSARAAEPRLVVVWSGPAECSRGDQVRDAALALSGPNRDKAPPIDAEVTVTKKGARYRVKLVTRQLGQTGEREIDGPSCDKIADAVSLVLSLMLTPIETTETVAPEGIAEVVKQKGKPQKRPLVPPPPAERTGLYGGPRLGADIGTLPHPTMFVGPALGWVLGKPRVEAYAQLFVPREVDEGPRADSGASLGLYAGGFRGCQRVFPGALSIDGCLGVETGGMYGQGRGIRDPDSSTVLYFAGTAGVALRGDGGTLPGIIAIEAVVPASRPAFTIEGYGEIYRSAAVSGRVLIGIEVGP
jgi:hypothetical protein